MTIQELHVSRPGGYVDVRTSVPNTRLTEVCIPGHASALRTAPRAVPAAPRRSVEHARPAAGRPVATRPRRAVRGEVRACSSVDTATCRPAAPAVVDDVSTLALVVCGVLLAALVFVVAAVAGLA